MVDATAMMNDDDDDEDIMMMAFAITVSTDSVVCPNKRYTYPSDSRLSVDVWPEWYTIMVVWIRRPRTTAGHTRRDQ